MAHRERHLITSRDVDAREPEQLTDKYVSIAAGQALDIASIHGPGRIVRIWLTLPVGLTARLCHLWLQIRWDGEEAPSVDCPVGDFFGASFGRRRPATSRWLSTEGGALTCTLPMPFADQARVTLINRSGRTITHVFFQVEYERDPGIQAPVSTFHARWRAADVSPGDPPVVAADIHGAGTFLGIKVDLQSSDWWLWPPLTEILLPRGCGLGLLEGWEEVCIDGGSPQAGTGLEDYFNGGFYFLGGPFATPTHGATVRSFFMGRASAYRLHEPPIPFRRSFRMTIDHGYRNTMAGQYTVVAYWYQQAPQAEAAPAEPFVFPLPLLQWMQWALVVGLPVLLLVAALLGLAWG